MISRPDRRAAKEAVSERATHSVGRTRAAFWPIVQSAVGAAVAYYLAQQLLGHPSPFFAAVATFVVLGISNERRLRRVGELSVGVTLGVAIGDVFVILFGSGPVQLAVARGTTVFLAQILNASPLVATQAGVQAVLVVALPPTAGSPIARWQDALVGSLVAICVAVLLPGDPRRLPRRSLPAVATELASILEQLAAALRTGDPVLADRALDRARGMQPLVDSATAELQGSLEITRIAPLRRRHRAEIERMRTLAVEIDRASRNTRVVARRAVPAVSDEHTLPSVADLVERLAGAVRELGSDAARGASQFRCRDTLETIAASLDPARVGGEDRSAAALVQLLRPLVVDLLEATGLEQSEARHLLAPA
jgi:uncharacterized membrane protein YgaE (UPF0421/DUF939 family)